MSKIIPAIIPTDSEHLRCEGERLAFAPTVQVDIVDGVFAQPASWPYNLSGEVAEAAALCEQLDVQVDIMALDPLLAVKAWHAVGATAFVLHLETVATPDAVITYTQQHQLELWLSADDAVPIDRYIQYLPDIHGVQLMGIDQIGVQGNPPSTRIIDNITALRAAAPRLPIQIDGSVNQETITALREAGATQFVVGSAISKAVDPRKAFQALCALV